MISKDAISAIMPLAEFNYGVNISQDHSFLYFENPKCACGTIKASLQMHVANAKGETLAFDSTKRLHDKSQSLLKSPDEIPHGLFQEMLQSNSVFIFSFVRNPYQRALSCYLDKMQDPWYCAKLGLSHFNGMPPFVEFLKAIQRQHIYEMDPHWRVQTYQIFYNFINYDFIGRFEKLAEDLPHVLKKIFREVSFGTLPHFGKGSTKQHTQYFTAEAVKCIQDIYMEDFINFNYPL
ncbi:sulfotransferase family protein [Solidesulfovibrio alcoholivorans]|uniref:sulfotransferase family protein n=1 Tax=Solidesulfovibrio alcoholivorans TaxID=81406 RepID=UPI000A07A1E6|nr:sulfotransferase family protein [Solidesulfovibrio alcoholivorans]